jgi:RimJ/RimL family protein N-acetyltransferase
VFGARLGHERLSARCHASNARNIRVLQRMGFKVEGIKRCPSGNIVMLGMLKSECRLLKRS